jgi:hypothetical protein
MSLILNEGSTYEHNTPGEGGKGKEEVRTEFVKDDHSGWLKKDIGNQLV